MSASDFYNMKEEHLHRSDAIYKEQGSPAEVLCGHSVDDWERRKCAVWPRSGMQPAMEGKKNILIVDDEEEIGSLLEVYLTNEGYQTFFCTTAKEAWECLREHEIDLALLDVMLPDTDGFTLCWQIRKKWLFPIIMLTAKVEETDRINGISLGADDYITKPFYPLEVVARVKAQLRRAGDYNRQQEEKKEEDFYEIHGLEVDAKTYTCRLYGEEIPLTPIEFSIILYLCRHLGEVVTSEEIFEKVWGEKYLGSNNTVFVHVARIREKLHENARKPRFIKTVWGVGYKIDRD